MATNHPVRYIEVNIAASHQVWHLPGRTASLPRRRLPNVRVTGLMTVAPRAADPESVRPVFRRLRDLAERHGLEQLSMGMTEDFETAIEEGATHIRVGRALFGERQ